MWLKNRFSKKNCLKAEHNKIKANQPMDTLIGRNTQIFGNVDFSGGLHVEGKIVGNLQSDGQSSSLLIVGNSANIIGDVRVHRAVVNGHISGNLYVNDHLELGEKAVILGDVHYNLLEMAVGSEIRGLLIPDIRDGRNLLEDHSQKPSQPDSTEQVEQAGADTVVCV